MQIFRTEEGKTLIEVNTRETDVLLCALYALGEKVEDVEQPVVQMRPDLHDGELEPLVPIVEFYQKDRDEMEDILTQYFFNRGNIEST